MHAKERRGKSPTDLRLTGQKSRGGGSKKSEKKETSHESVHFLAPISEKGTNMKDGL